MKFLKEIKAIAEAAQDEDHHQDLHNHSQVLKKHMSLPTVSDKTKNELVVAIDRIEQMMQKNDEADPMTFDDPDDATLYLEDHDKQWHMLHQKSARMALECLKDAVSETEHEIEQLDEKLEDFEMKIEELEDEKKEVEKEKEDLDEKLEGIQDAVTETCRMLGLPLPRQRNHMDRKRNRY